jgi:hypothetical protein
MSKKASKKPKRAKTKTGTILTKTALYSKGGKTKW